MKKILVGEDSNIVKNMTKKVLEHQSYAVGSARDGKSLYEMFLKSDFDLILLDIQMPIMDGLTCASKIRREAPAHKKNVPIFFVTGNGNNHRVEDLKGVGADECILKPINYDSLVRKMQEYLS